MCQRRSVGKESRLEGKGVGSREKGGGKAIEKRRRQRSKRGNGGLAEAEAAESTGRIRVQCRENEEEWRKTGRMARSLCVVQFDLLISFLNSPNVPLFNDRLSSFIEFVVVNKPSCTFINTRKDERKRGR